MFKTALKTLVFWYADLWPADGVFCIYVRFWLNGVACGLIAAALVVGFAR